MGEVVSFKTREKIVNESQPLPSPEPDAILKDAMGKLQSVVVIGLLPNGDGYVSADVAADDDGFEMILGILESLLDKLDGSGPPAGVA